MDQVSVLIAAEKFAAADAEFNRVELRANQLREQCDINSRDWEQARVKKTDARNELYRIITAP